MSSMKLPPEPPTGADNYTLWRKDIDLWKKLTDTPKSKMGVALQYACRSNRRIHEAVLNIAETEVDCEEGIANVLKVLDTLHNIDEKETALQLYEEFEVLKRKHDQKVSDFILQFEASYNKTKNAGHVLSDELLASKLLRALNLSDTDHRIVRASVTTFTMEEVKAVLKKTHSVSTYNSTEIKIEPTYLTSEAGRGYRYKENVESHQHQEKIPTASREKSNTSNKWRNKPKFKPLYNIVLFEDDDENPENIKSLIHESMGCAVLDCGAPKTVCGRTWLNTYIDALSKEDQALLKYTATSSMFEFGSGKRLKAYTSVMLPVVLGTKKASIITDVIEDEIPLLFSRIAMKRAKTILDTANDKVTMLGQVINLITTSTGHYAVPICSNRAVLDQDKVNINLLSTNPNISRKEIAIKLHRQFAHPPAERLLRLIEQSKYDHDNDLKKQIKEVTENCTTCTRFKPSPPRLCHQDYVVNMPTATRFNEIVAIDIKFYKGKPLLHIIDVLTRFSTCSALKSKESKVVIQTIFDNWISIFGPPEKFLSNNTGEFANENIVVMEEAFNIPVVTTAAESPWSNELCDRYNTTIGEMVSKILEEVDCSLSVAVSWATSAKNGLQNIHGFSPAQLVLGYNPMLPCVQTDKPPALSESTYTHIVEQNLQAMRTGRVAQIQAESSNRIRRALNQNITSSGDIKYINGDLVYYKRKDDNEWHGPGTVIGQCGQCVLVKSQYSWIRAHPCKLQLLQKEAIPEAQHEGDHQKNDSSDYPITDRPEEEEVPDTSQVGDNESDIMDIPNNEQMITDDNQVQEIAASVEENAEGYNQIDSDKDVLVNNEEHGKDDVFADGDESDSERQNQMKIK